MGARSSQLQIRVTPAEKAALKRLAHATGQSVSNYVLTRVLPREEMLVAELYQSLADSRSDPRRKLVELARILEHISPSDIEARVPEPEPGTLGPVLMNSIAALIESAAHEKGASTPPWVATVPPLPRPHFGWPLRSLRPHQLRVTPVPFKRRNLFFDPAAGPSP